MSVTNGGQEESRSPSASHDGVKSRSGSADTPSSNRPSKLSRKASQKLAASREPVLFDHLPDMTAESCNFFQLIPDCLYGSKHLGSTDNDALDCECREEWRTLPTEPLWCIANFSLQTMAKILHVARTRTASIERQKWNVALRLEIVQGAARISGSSASSTPTFLSSRQKRRDSASAPTLIYKPMTSSLSTSAKSSTSLPFAAE